MAFKNYYIAPVRPDSFSGTYIVKIEDSDPFFPPQVFGPAFTFGTEVLQSPYGPGHWDIILFIDIPTVGISTEGWQFILESKPVTIAGGGTISHVLPPALRPVTTITPASSGLTSFDTWGRQIPYSMGARRLQGAKIWAKGIEGGETQGVDPAFGNWAEAFGYPLKPGEDIFANRIWFDGNLIWSLDDGIVLEGMEELTFRVYTGTETQLPDPDIVLDKGVTRTPGFRGLIYIVFLNVDLAPISNRMPMSVEAEFLPTDELRINVSDVQIAVGALADVVVECDGIDDTADGVVFANGLNPRDEFETYSDIYNYRIIDGDPIVLQRRVVGDSLVIDAVLVAQTDFVAQGGLEDIVALNRAEDSELPNQVQLQYTDQAINYQRSTQYAKRPRFPIPATTSHLIKTSTTDFIITAVEALALSYDMLYRAWTRRLTAKFTLMKELSEVEEADVLQVPTTQGTFIMDVTRRTMLPDQAVQIETANMLAVRGVDADADAGDILVNSVIRPCYYPQLLWGLNILVSSGRIWATGTCEGSILSSASTTIPSRLSHIDAINVNLGSNVFPLGILPNNASFPVADVDFVYYVGIGQAAGTKPPSVRRVDKLTHAVTVLDLGTATDPDPSDLDGFYGQAAISDGHLYLATPCTDYTARPADSPSIRLRLWIADLHSFDASGVSVVDLGAGFECAGLAIASGYVLVSAVHRGSTAADAQKLFRYEIATGTIDSVDLDHPLGKAAASVARIFFMPYTGVGRGSAFGTADSTNVFAAKINPSTIDTDGIEFFDITDHPGVVLSAGGNVPWVDTVYLYFLANNVADLSNAPMIARRRIDGASPVVADGFDLTFVMDNLVYQPFCGATDGQYHYVAGYAALFQGIQHGNGFLLKITRDFTSSLFHPLRQAPPSNDNFANAAYIGVGQTKSSNNEFATEEAGEPDHDGNPGGRSVWWVFSPPTSNWYRISIAADQTFSSIKATLGVYTGSDVSDLTEVASTATVAGQSNVLIPADVPTHYRIAADGWNYPDTIIGRAIAGQIDHGILSITVALVDLAPTDDFADAQTIFVGQNKTANTRYATKEVGEPDHAGDAGGHSVWWKFTAAEDGTFDLTTSGSDFDTLLAVYTGSAVGSLSEVASDFTSGVGASMLSFAGTLGTVYRIAVDGAGGTYGNVMLALTEETSGGASLPAGATAMLDFVSGTYLYGVNVFTASEVLGHPEFITPGLGLIVGHDGGGGSDPSCAILGDFATFLLAGDWTVVIEFVRGTANSEPLHINDPTDDNPNSAIVLGSGFVDFNSAVPFAEDIVSYDSLLAHVIAATRRNASNKLSFSFDGRTVVQSAATIASGFPGVTNAWIGGPSSTTANGYILVGRIVFYSVQLDADLPGLAVLTGDMQPPENDNFTNATVISSGQTLQGHNFQATHEVGEPNHNSANGQQSVWWSFTAPLTTSYTVSLAGTPDNGAFGWVIAVYTGGAVGSLTPVASAHGWPLPTPVAFSATSGTTYHIAIDSWGPNAASGTIEISMSVTAGGAKTLSAGSAAFLLTGTAATLRTVAKLLAGSGSFALTGTDATLSATANKTLAAGGGTYILGGTDATLKTNKVFTAGSGSFEVSGTSASVVIAKKVTAGAGIFALTGTAATLTKASSGILDGVTGVTAAWDMSRNLLSAFGGSRYTDASGFVSSLNDQTGNGRNLTGSVGARPAVGTAGPNTLAAARFDGADDYLVGAALSNFMSNSAGYMLCSFIINTVTANSGNPYENEPVWGDAGGFMGLYIRNTTGTPETAQAYNFSGGNQSAEAAVITPGTAYVVEWWHDSGNVFICVNNGTPVSVSSGNTGNVGGVLGLGHGYTGSSVFSDIDVFGGFAASAVPAARSTIAADFMTQCGAV